MRQTHKVNSGQYPARRLSYAELLASLGPMRIFGEYERQQQVEALRKRIVEMENPGLAGEPKPGLSVRSTEGSTT